MTAIYRRSTALALSLITSAATPASAAPRDVSDLVRSIVTKHHVPGLVGAIVNVDGVTAIGAAGVRKIGSPEPFTIGDQIHLGSDTKAMTAALIAIAIERGDLSYDTTMAQAFPDLAAKMDPVMAAVTVEQLLNHRGGMPANVAWANYARGGGSLIEQRRRIVEAVLTAKPSTTPGSSYVYSNVGYMLLGAILEAKAGKPWEDLIARDLFQPLGMTSAGFGPPGTRGQVDQPWGHVLDHGEWKPSQTDNAPPLGPAGTAHCTVEDWSKFIAWSLRCARADTPLLSRRGHERLLTPLERSEYAGGWILTSRPWAGGTVWTHAGSNTTWYCVAWLAPKRGFAVVAATNCAGDAASKACDDLAAALIAERDRSATATTQPGH